MKLVPSLNLGFNDAENYKRRENKDFLNHIFLKDMALDKLCSKETFFLVGEKGTGKTAYSVFLQNNTYADTKAKVFYIRETEYQSFVALKHEKQLQLSEYGDVWKVILFVLIGKSLTDRDAVPDTVSRFTKLAELQKAIDTYYHSAFAPEIIYALNFIKESGRAAKIISELGEAGVNQKQSVSFSESRFQVNLLYIERQFKEALSALKLSLNHVIFIDGIDIRPASIPFEEYIACIKGLANAVWSLNNDFFPTIRDTPGRIRVVLLIRPDIFAALGLQNQNAKIRDNSVLLDWRTTYQNYRTSSLFLMTDKLLSSQQSELLELGQTWDYYFPYSVLNYTTKERSDSSFISFLRYSLYRPRDIITMLGILKDLFVESQKQNGDVFSEADFDRAEFRRRYGDYLMGEIKDHLTFYYTDQEYEYFLKFFDFLRGKPTFDYSEYLIAFAGFKDFAFKNNIKLPSFSETSGKFLQFLYELNIISYSEDREAGVFYQWCFRERSYSNIAPKVKTEARYQIHAGIANTLNTGSRLLASRKGR